MPKIDIFSKSVCQSLDEKVVMEVLSKDEKGGNRLAISS